MKSTILSIIAATLIIFGAIIFSNSGGNGGNAPAANNVSVIDGKQIVEIKAKGGYLPKKSAAKAGLSTVLRVSTSGTFDCSIAVRIPSLKIARNLPPSGVTDIDLGTPVTGVLYGTCAMGMYPFEIDFQK